MLPLRSLLFSTQVSRLPTSAATLLPLQTLGSRQVHNFPTLMELPQTHLPQINHTLRNWFLTAALIRPYFDPDFTIKEFVRGAQCAAGEVSRCLSEGDMVSLDGLLTPDAIDAVKKSLSLFSLTERHQLGVKEDDIYHAFLYQIGILMDDEMKEDGTYGRQVECTWVAHSIPNYAEMMEECEGHPVKIKEAMEAKGGPVILNYRFIRDYTKGREEPDTWTINALNYFRLYEMNR